MVDLGEEGGSTCRQQFLLGLLCNTELFLAWSFTIFVVLKPVGFSGVWSVLCKIWVSKTHFAGIARVSPLNILKKSLLLLFFAHEQCSFHWR